MGMSMSKTAAAAAVGALLCDGKIKSLDDKAGAYASFLKRSPMVMSRSRISCK